MKHLFHSFLILLSVLPTGLLAQTGVPVKISAVGDAAGTPPRQVGDLAELWFEASFMPSLPTNDDGDYYAHDGYTGSGTAELSIAPDTVQLEPGKSYYLYAHANYATAFALNMVAPPGYVMEIDGERRSQYAVTSIPNYFYSDVLVVRVLKAADALGQPVRAGAGSSLAGDRIFWEAGMGALQNGSTAGKISLIDTGTASSWAAIFTPAIVNYEAPSPEVTVYRSGGNVRQILANETAVDVVTINSTQFEIRFYHPDQAEGASFPRTFTGLPFVIYRFEEGATSTTLKATCITRNLISLTDTSASPVRTAVSTLERSGSPWPAYTWTLRDWHTDGQTPLTEVVSTSSAGAGSNRNHSIVVQGYNGGTVATRIDQVYTPLTDWGELLVSQTHGTSTGLTTTSAYYTNPASPGDFGYLYSQTEPGGGWTAYDYYDTAYNQGGTIKHRYRPFGGSPASVTLDPTQGEVTYYEYSVDPFGMLQRPSLIETRVNNTLTAKSVISYSDVAGAINGQTVVEVTRNDYSDASHALTTKTRYYKENATEFFLRGQVHSVQRPDGLKVSYAYQRGSLSGTTFTKSGSDGLGAGEASRVAVITGSATTGSSYTSYDGYDIDNLYLVTGKSTLELTIRDQRALVVRKETHAWDGSAWQLVGSTDYTYNYAGELTGRVASNGGTYSATYNGQQLADETDETGVKLSYGYDVEGRLLTVTKENGPITTYARDAAGRETSSTVGTSETIVTSTAYDDAGRVTSVTPPGLSATTIAYNAGSRTRTATAPDGGTTIETYQLDGRLASITGTAVVSQTYTYDIDNGRFRTRVDHGSSTRWQKSWQDWLGRGVKTERPGFSATSQPSFVEEYIYDTTTGLLAKYARLDGNGNRLFADELFTYDELGQVAQRGLDIGNGGTLVLASTDRIIGTDRRFESYAGAWWLREETKTYPTNNSDTPHTESLVRTRLTGFSGIQSEVQTTASNGAVITRTAAVNRPTKTVTYTTSQSGINNRVETVVNGLPTSVTGSDGLTYTTGYDALGRPNTFVDPRTGTTTTVYVTGSTRPYTVTDATGLLVSFGYDTSGRKTLQGNADSKYARFEYNTRGQLYRQWGDTVNPVEHGYDPTYGDHLTQKTYRGGSGWNGTTWPGSPGTADTTTWAYDAATGLLSSKTDALSHAVNYSYNARGQTHQRIADRGVSATVTTTYSYDSATGELTGAAYSDGTPSLAYYYNRIGRTYQVDDATGARTFDLGPCGRVNAETFPASFYGTRVLTYQYETGGGLVGRYQGFQLGSSAGSSADLEQDYTFTSGGRFDTLISQRENNSVSRTFQYGYLTNSSLVNALSITGGHAFSVARGYHASRDLLESIDSKWNSTTQTRFDYTHTALMQRQTAKQSGAAFTDYWSGQGYSAVYNVYGYNARGEVETAALYRGNTPSATPAATDELPGRRFEYRYDPIGNRTLTRGTASATADDEDYTANAANQYTAKENNVVRFAGTAAAGANIAVAGAITTERLDRAWSAKLTPDNTSTAVQGTASVHAAVPGGGSGGADLVRTETVAFFVPKRSQTFSYDYAGNLTADSVWDYAYDAENRLVSMQTRSEVIGSGMLADADARRLEFTYDYLGRRVRKIVRGDWNGSVYTTVLSNRKYLYDGWNLIAEFDAISTLTLVKSYTWGLDVTGSLTAAGGVGALVQIRDHATSKTWLPTYDGNGNVVSLINDTTGAIAAIYEYGPFGEPLRTEIIDEDAAENAFRFSSKYMDVETGLVYYGHRFYSPSLGRFVNQDPIAEQGGLNLYGFVGNDPVNRWDYLGMNIFSDFFNSLYNNVPFRPGIVRAQPDEAADTEVIELPPVKVPGTRDEGFAFINDYRLQDTLDAMKVTLTTVTLNLPGAIDIGPLLPPGDSDSKKSEAPNKPEDPDCAGLRASRDTLRSQLNAGRAAITRANGDYISTINGTVTGSTLDQVGTLVANYNSGSLGIDVVGTAASELHLPTIGKAVSGFGRGFSSVTLGVGFGLGAGDIADGNYFEGISQIYGASVGTGALFGDMLATDGVISASAGTVARTVGTGAVILQTAIFFGQETYAGVTHVTDLRNQQATISQIQGRIDMQVKDLRSVYDQLQAKGCK